MTIRSSAQGSGIAVMAADGQPSASTVGDAFGAATVSLRRFPFPFVAMLAVCSDLDETPDARVYHESARFLNTGQSTTMGTGVGLEVGNTIYFDMMPGQFAYWNTDDQGREMVRTMIRSGHIDCLHSFGDLATTRTHAARALEELVRHGCRLRVWIDHATAPTNFGSDIMRGAGDVPGADAYHADLSTAYGIQYVWRGRVTSVIGQGPRRSLRGIFDPGHSRESAVTAAKEGVKGLLGRAGSPKYRAHAKNAVSYGARLRDGRPVVEFLRANPHFRGVSGGDTAVGIPEVLTARFLDHLIAREGFCILYTHLGKVADPREPFGPRAQGAFRLLAERQQSGKVLVTTTRRLLGYAQVAQNVRVSTAVDPSVTTIQVNLPGFMPQRSSEPQDIDGLTFYTSPGAAVRLLLNGQDLTGTLRHNPQDHTGRTSVSLPWRRLTFPDSL